MISCDHAQSLVSDRLDGALSDTQRAQLDAHLNGCADCRAVAADLEKLHADAAALPLLTPSRDLWAGIEARLDAKVVSIHAQRTFQLRFTGRQLAAAAAVLMAVTAGGTWFVTTRNAGLAPSANVPSAARTELVSVANQKGVAVYQGEIAKLKDIIEQRRADLDPKTVAILEKNLKLIDTAIAECQAALAANPASAFLAEQLNRTYDTKLDLLRSAALLPSRT
jgi:hypothetical protein